MQGPVPDQFNLVVTDMGATVAFYRKLGLTIPDTDPQWQHHHRTATLPGGIDLDLDSSQFARHWNVITVAVSTPPGGRGADERCGGPGGCTSCRSP